MNQPDFLIDHPDDEIRLTGRRIGLFDVGQHLQEGRSAEWIAEAYDLPLELVQQVVAFALQHWPEVEVYLRDYQAEVERQEAEYSQGPTLAEPRRRWQEKGLGPLP